MTDRYAVIGHPVAHSKSPDIHAAFAQQTGQSIRYDRLDAAPDAFEETVADFFAMGGCGCNITVPFKERAYQFASTRTARAEAARAVNTLLLGDDGVCGDNTDGVGLVRDLQRHCAIAGRRVLLLGAGGAARGVLGPLLAQAPARITIANRSVDKAEQLAAQFARQPVPLVACGYDDLREAADLVVNATTASLAQVALPLADSLWQAQTVAYDLMYADGDTPFMAQARAAGAVLVLDGLGMLVEQAAEAFFLWRGVRPDTHAMLADLRAGWRHAC